MAYNSCPGIREANICALDHPHHHWQLVYPDDGATSGGVEEMGRLRMQNSGDKVYHLFICARDSAISGNGKRRGIRRDWHIG